MIFVRYSHAKDHNNCLIFNNTLKKRRINGLGILFSGANKKIRH